MVRSYPFQKYIVFHSYYKDIHLTVVKSSPIFPKFSQYVSTLFPNTESHGDGFLNLLPSVTIHSPKFIPIEIGIPSWIPNLGWNSKLNMDSNWNSKLNSWSVERVYNKFYNLGIWWTNYDAIIEVLPNPGKIVGPTLFIAKESPLAPLRWTCLRPLYFEA